MPNLTAAARRAMLERAQAMHRERAAAQLTAIPDVEQVERQQIVVVQRKGLAERITALKSMLALRGPGPKRDKLAAKLKLVEQENAALDAADLAASIPAPVRDDTMPSDTTRVAGETYRVFDPAQAGAPGGTVTVRGPMNGALLNVRPHVAAFAAQMGLPPDFLRRI